LASSAFERFAGSAAGFEAGQRFLPAGVSSPIRTFDEVRTPPVVIDSADGCRMRDVDGNEYVDFMSALGPLILGHSPPAITEAIVRQARRGTVYATPTELEYQLAEQVLASTPCLDQLRFVCSGTEAVMTAVRLARAATDRELIVKFRGCYHGHADTLLASAGPSVGRRSRGLPAGLEASVLVLDYNDAAGVRAAFDARPEEIAAVVVEPYACNMGLVLPEPGFLEELRAACDRSGALLIFDEVVTGFRFCYGSIANLLGVQPDLVTFGKIIGGGTPIGAYAGRREHMSLLEDAGGVFQGGTFAGNPLSMAAGLAMLAELREPGFYDRLDGLGQSLEDALVAGLAGDGLGYGLVRAGSAASLVLIEGAPPVRCHSDAARQDAELYGRLHLELMCAGFLLPPSIDEVFFLSAAHTADDVTRLATAVVEALAALRAGSPRA